MNKKRFLFLMLLISVLCSCTSWQKFKEKYWGSVNQNEEYEQMVQVKEIKTPEANTTTVPVQNNVKQTEVQIEPKDLPKSMKGKKSVKHRNGRIKVSQNNSHPNDDKVNTEIEDNKPPKREPDLEDTVGMWGRRPLKDPFRVGEKVKLRLSYFGVTAGFLNLEVLPFVEVNGRKSYHFLSRAESNESFEWVYTVKDKADSYLDYEDLVPYTYSLEVKESSQVAQSKLFFDFKKMKAIFWDKRYSKSRGNEEKKQEWDILPYVQNVFTAVFYVRIFEFKPGKEIAFRVSNEGENLVFRGKVIRKERIKTEAGELDTVVIKPEFEIGGIFTPVGDIYIWFTDDDRKMLVKLESKIQIGTIVGEVVELQR